MKDYYSFWGKARPENPTGGPAYHLLVYHSLDVAAVRQLISSKMPILKRSADQWCGPIPRTEIEISD